jgi:hypothetical protein
VNAVHCETDQRVGRRRVRPQLAVNREHGDAVDHRPDEACELREVLALDVSRALQGVEGVDQDLEGGRGVCLQVGVPPAQLLEPSEHDPVVRRVGDREANVRDPHGIEASSAPSRRIPRLQQLAPESLKAFPGNCREERRFVGEVPVEGRS